jgi:hypothetical protein
VSLTPEQKGIIKDAVRQYVYPSCTDLARKLGLSGREDLQRMYGLANYYRARLFPDKPKRPNGAKTKHPVVIKQTIPIPPPEVIPGPIPKPSMTPLLINFLKWRLGESLKLEELHSLVSWIKTNAPDFEAHKCNDDLLDRIKDDRHLNKN